MGGTVLFAFPADRGWANKSLIFLLSPGCLMHLKSLLSYFLAARTNVFQIGWQAAEWRHFQVGEKVKRAYVK
jgi:hypothetical protein